MSFKDKYKKDNEIVKINKDTLERLSNNTKSMTYKNNNKKKVRALIAVASIMFCVVAYYSIEKVTTDKNGNEIALDSGKKNSNNEGSEKTDKIENDSNLLLDNSNEESKYYIQEGKIRVNTNASYSNGFIIYKGRIYDANTSYNISLEDGKALMGEKIGVTWNYDGNDIRVTETDGYLDIKNTEDFWSIISGEEVYTFKGYSNDFRLIVYRNNEYGEYLSIYENLSNMPLNKGEDIFKRMNMKGNVKMAKWQSFENWNYGIEEYQALDSNIDIDSFIEALYNAEPESLENEEFRSQFFYKESQNPNHRKVETKFLYLKLKDGIEVRLRLFSNGYVSFDAVRGFIFKVEDEEFNKLWNEMN